MIALLATAISTVIGALLALALWRFRFPGKPAFEGAMALPIVIPEICMGVALMAFFIRTGWPTALPWPLNLGPIVIGHVAFCFPFVAIVVRARMAGFDRALEEASKDLGAGEWQTFRRITLPYMKPGLIAGALLAMTLSLDDFVITFFTSGPETLTFPVKVYSMVRFGATPEVNAASTMLIVVTIVLTVIAMRLQRPTQTAESGRMSAPAIVRIEGVTKRFGERGRGRRRVARHPAERVLRAARAVGLRQDHAVAHARRASSGRAPGGS